MSVLINMDMPRTCGVCELCGCYTESKGEVHRCDISMYVIKDLERRLDDCPLIEVPEPHGRLIDADKYLGTIRPLCPEDSQAACTFETVKMLMMNSINKAPTVIPASEVET